jgi:hypothetical protein
VDGATVVIKAATGAGPSYTVTTDAAGYFVAGALPNGVAWKVTLEPPAGYTLVTGALTRTTAVLGSGQTADNIDFLGKVTVPITFVSQQRTLSASYYVDPEFAPYEGTAMSATGGQGAAATGYGSFDSYTDASFGTPDYNPPFVSAEASQDSSLTATELTANGDASAFVNEAGNGAGASNASADSRFQVTFQVYAPQTYSISATLAPTPNHLFESVSLTLTGPGGTTLIAQTAQGPGPTVNINKSGTLAPGIYTITLDAPETDNDGSLPSATYSLDMKIGK